MKNPQFFLNFYETWGKYSPLEVIMFPKFHNNWAKIVDFLRGHSDFRTAFLIKLRLYMLCCHTELIDRQGSRFQTRYIDSTISRYWLDVYVTVFIYIQINTTIKSSIK